MSGTSFFVGSPGTINSETIANTLDFVSSLFGVGDGANSTGTLTILSGGTVDSGGSIWVGAGIGATGLVLIEAGGTLAVSATPNPSNESVQIGLTGSLAPTSAGTTGTISVTGAGALLTTNDNPLQLGRFAGGSGTLDVTGGATATMGTTSDASTADSGLSVGYAGSASVLVSGTGSSLSVTGNAYFAHSGSGTLVVSNGATFSGGDATDGIYIGNGNTNGAGGTGIAFVSSDAYLASASNLEVGRGGDTGTLEITGGSTADVANRLLIGDLNSTLNANGNGLSGTGFLEIGSGSKVLVGGAEIPNDTVASGGTAALEVGDGVGSTGTVVISDSVLNLGTQHIAIGNGGTGAVTLSQGGSVIASINSTLDAATGIGENAGQGLLVVTDSTSTWTDLGQMNVGTNGPGTLEVENGGTVDTGHSPGGPDGGFVIAWGTASSGSVTVTGAGSNINNSGRFDIGGAGTSTGEASGGVGSLLISAGADVTTTRSDAGPGFPAAGIADYYGTGGSAVTVTGANSTWQVAGPMIVGYYAAGTLDVASAGTVSAISVDAGELAGSSGTINLTGTSSQLNVSGSLSLGDSGTASLSVGVGAIVDAASINVGTGDAVTLLGGAFDSLSTINNEGTITAIGAAAVSGAIAGAGDIVVGQTGDLQINGAVASGQTLDFASTTGTVTLEQPGSFAGTITGFTTGDQIDAVGASSGTIAAGVLTLFSGATELGTLAIANAPTGFSVTSIAGGLQIADATPTPVDDVTTTTIPGGFEYVTGSDNDSVTTTAGDDNIVKLGSGQDTVYSNGADTLVASTGAATVAASANAIMFTQSAPLVFYNGAGRSIVVIGAAATVNGGSGSVQAFGGSDALVAYGGTAGGNALVAAGGSATFNGGAAPGGTKDIFVGGAVNTSDVMNPSGPSAIFAAAANVVINGSAGNVTLIGGSGSTTLNNGSGNNAVFGGTGATTINETTGTDYVATGAGAATVNQQTGYEALVMGSGNVVLNEGSGTDLIALFDGQAGGNLTINNFKIGTDTLYLGGYGANEQANDLANASTSAAGTTLTLSDGSHITFAGLSSLSNAIF